MWGGRLHGQPCGEAGSVDSLVGKLASWTALWGGRLPVDSLVGRLASWTALWGGRFHGQPCGEAGSVDSLVRRLVPSGQPYGLPSNRVRHPVKWTPCVSLTQRSPESRLALRQGCNQASASFRGVLMGPWAQGPVDVWKVHPLPLWLYLPSSDWLCLSNL